jgi:hypothetical protein
MIDYACGDISPQKRRTAEDHLESCSECKNEYRQYLEIFEKMDSLSAASEEAMAAIDWDRNAQEISRNTRVRSSRSSRPISFTFNILNWKALLPLTASVLLIGIWLGYLLFHSAAANNSVGPGTSNATPQFSLARLEAAITEKEVSGYMKDAQLIITDLMRQCDLDGNAFYRDRLNKQQVKSMLNKSKYFNRDLNNPRLLSSRNLLKKIEWLLYEILALEKNVSCDQLQRLQDYIRRERLLLKIRLIGKDITEV